MNENYIKCTLHEDESGMNHNIEINAKWKDSHHFLDMIAACIERWKNAEHEMK